MMANVLLFALAPNTLNSIAYTWLLASLGIVGSRLALNIRVELADPSNRPRAGSNLALDDLSSLHLSQIPTAPGPPPARYSTAHGRASEPKIRFAHPRRTGAVPSPPSLLPEPPPTSRMSSSHAVVSSWRSGEPEAERLFSALKGRTLSYYWIDPQCRRAVHIAETIDDCY